MLLSNMNTSEIKTQLRRDYEKLEKSTLPRLCQEYDRERKRLKIDKERTWAKAYTVKTASKNNWIISLQKRPTMERYKGLEAVIGCPVTYYYDHVGLVVLHWTPGTEIVQSYNGHFFERYNERMALGLTSPLEIVKYFFQYNGHAHYVTFQKDGTCHLVGFSKDGLMLGLYHEKDNWMKWKTFVSRDLVREDQEEMEAMAFSQFQKEIEEAIRTEAISGKRSLELDQLKGVSG
jgi:hypothetical protein